MSPLMNIVLGLIFLSTFFGWFFCHSKDVEKPVKAMLFVLYFWGSFFIQIIVFSGLYYFGLLEKFI